MFQHIVDGYEYQFSVVGFPEEKHDWLCSILGNILDQVHIRGVATGKAEVQEAVRTALGFGVRF